MIHMPASLVPASSGIAILVIVFLAQALKEMGIPSLGLTHSLLLYAGCQFSSGNPYFGSAIILFTFSGSLCGASLIFCLARRKGNKLQAWLDSYAVIKPDAMARARRVLTTCSLLTISMGRSIPGLMVPTSILASTLDFPVSSFFTGIIVTLSLWVAVIVTTGSTLDHFIPQINISPVSLLGFLVPIIGVGVIFGVLYMRRIRPRTSEYPPVIEMVQKSNL
jgi:membrane protein DedA with SNARE-associated domain